MADLDAELGHRLERLAEAVPVAPWLGHLESNPVRARHQVRMAWLTPLVAIAAVIVGSSLLNTGSGDPAASPSPATALHLVNVDGPAVEVSVGAQVLATLECGTTATVLPSSIPGGLPVTLDIRAVGGELLDTVTVEGPLPRGLLVRGTSVLTGPWPMSYGPAPTAACAPATGAAVIDTAAVGPYVLELRSERAVYHESDLIEVTGTFTYSGQMPNVVEGFKAGFGVLEPVYGISMQPAYTLECNQTTFEPGTRTVTPFGKSGGVSGSDPQKDFKLAYLRDPEFRLPPGTWHLQYSAFWYEDECGDERTRVSVQIEIVVLPESAAQPSIEPPVEIELLTHAPIRTADGRSVCMMALATGYLGRSARTGLGLAATPGAGAYLDVSWPESWSAWIEDGRAVLRDESGDLIAVEGDEMELGGGNVGDVFHTCG